MNFLKENFPVLLSPKFWGIVLTALAYWLSQYGFTFSAEALSQFLLIVSGGATTVGVVDSAARKLGA